MVKNQKGETYSEKKKKILQTFKKGPLTLILEDTARYKGLLLAPAEGFGQKRVYYAILAHFRQFLLSSSNLGNFFVLISVILKNIHKNQKNSPQTKI